MGPAPPPPDRVPPAAPAPASPAGPARRLGPLLIGGSFLLLAFLNAWLALRGPSADDGLTAVLVDPANPRWTLSDPLDGTPRAVAWFERAGGRLLLFAKGLPAAGSGRSYVLWWRPAGGGAARRAGAFRPRPGVGPDLVVGDAVSFRDLDGLLVTEEASPDVRAPDANAVRAVARPARDASDVAPPPAGR